MIKKVARSFVGFCKLRQLNNDMRFMFFGNTFLKLGYNKKSRKYDCIDLKTLDLVSFYGFTYVYIPKGLNDKKGGEENGIIFGNRD